MVGTFGMNFNIWIPMLASDSFGSGAGTYGLLFTAMGVGSLAGALTLAMFGKSPEPGSSMLGVDGGARLGRNPARDRRLDPGRGHQSAWRCWRMAGFASSNAMATANTLVQTVASDALRGRVMAVYMTVFAGTTPFGALISGAIADRYGVRCRGLDWAAPITLCCRASPLPGPSAQHLGIVRPSGVQPS